MKFEVLLNADYPYMVSTLGVSTPSLFDLISSMQVSPGDFSIDVGMRAMTDLTRSDDPFSFNVDTAPVLHHHAHFLPMLIYNPKTKEANRFVKGSFHAFQEVPGLLIEFEPNGMRIQATVSCPKVNKVRTLRTFHLTPFFFFSEDCVGALCPISIHRNSSCSHRRFGFWLGSTIP